MRGNKLRSVLCLLLAGTVLAAFVAIAADVGSQGDPLVTLSYLNETFLGQVMDKVDEKLTGRNDTLRKEMEQEISKTERELLSQLGGGSGDSAGGIAAAYTEVTLTAGQTLCGSTGCEVMLRSGSATCVSEGKSTPGLVDSTTGGSINHGTALVKDHLYMMTAERGVKASGDVTLLVRGEYVIG